MEQPESSFPVIPLVSLAISFLVCKGEGKKSKIKKMYSTGLVLLVDRYFRRISGHCKEHWDSWPARAGLRYLNET